MNYNEVKEKINDINIENHIWLIYIIIIFASWYSNSLERNYFLTNDIKCKKGYRNVIIKIFTILVIVYLYFFKSAMDDVNELKSKDNLKKRKLTELSAIGSLCIVISGLIFLYIALTDNDIDVELAFS